MLDAHLRARRSSPRVLEQERVNGSILLYQIRMPIVREDLGICNLGRAVSILELIDELREKRDRYRTTAYYTAPYSTLPEYTAGHAGALERQRRTLPREECPEYNNAIDTIERVQQLEA